MVMRMKELNKTFVLQHDASDCGVACLLSIIRYYGGSNIAIFEGAERYDKTRHYFAWALSGLPGKSALMQKVVRLIYFH